MLIVGGGDGGAAREVLKHDIEEVVMCEIDKVDYTNVMRSQVDEMGQRQSIDGCHFVWRLIW